jgi:hypothetical protein
MSALGSGIAEGRTMITMGIGVCAGVLYWLGCYKLAFWILIYAIVYGALGVLRGDNQARLAYRGNSDFTIAVLIPVAWHIGGLAGYL